MKKIISFGIQLCISVIAFGQSVNAKLEEAVMTFTNQEKFTGSVLVARKGEVLLHKGYGLKNAAAAQPNSTKSIFQVASLAKQFTAAVILKLI